MSALQIIAWAVYLPGDGMPIATMAATSPRARRRAERYARRRPGATVAPLWDLLP